jgi:ubiquinone/menaquinone biosynthesis C-methylase UbiE
MKSGPKDLFSAQASEYARFRPGYPEALFLFLFAHSPAFERAWDCATGNGQIAVRLAERFGHVDATDISARQLQHAGRHPRIHYALGQAEAPDFPDAVFDLITVGQAAHWFDLERFYAQAQRVLKPNGLLALVGYVRLRTEPAVASLIETLYSDVLGPYWDPERNLVDTEYQTLPFPFEEITLPPMYVEYAWTRTQLSGYLSTWSAVQRYVQQTGQSPFSGEWLEQMAAVWPDEETRTVQFPVFGRVGYCR